MLTYQRFGLLDVLMPEKKLAIEIAQIYGIQVDYLNVVKSSKDQVLQQLASDATSSDHQDL